jgi:Domain of unknown function (DUF6457)
VSTQESGYAATEEPSRGDETRKMAAMNAWLDEVCAELGVDRDLVSATTPTMLRLIGRVAHGPSRPGAPLTAFVVGLAAAEAARDGEVGTGGAGPVAPGTDDARAAAVRQRVDAVAALVERWTERQA